MRKFLLIFLVLVSVFLGYSLARDRVSEDQSKDVQNQPRVEILKFALVADSENENGLLAKALKQAEEAEASFVIGLGDWSNAGMTGELAKAKQVFDDSGLEYYITAGDHDLWDSRNQGSDPKQNFNQIFGKSSHVFGRQGVVFVILDNSDIYLGMSTESLELTKNLANSTLSSQNSKLTFVFAHKTLFHPQSAHVMGEGNVEVSRQARKLMDLLEEKKVDGFFSGDLHFFARFNSPANVVKMTTIGAVASEKNFQGPRFAMVKVYSDWSWEVADVEIR